MVLTLSGTRCGDKFGKVSSVFNPNCSSSGDEDMLQDFFGFTNPGTSFEVARDGRKNSYPQRNNPQYGDEAYWVICHLGSNLFPWDVSECGVITTGSRSELELRGRSNVDTMVISVQRGLIAVEQHYSSLTRSVLSPGPTRFVNVDGLFGCRMGGLIWGHFQWQEVNPAQSSYAHQLEGVKGNKTGSPAFYPSTWGTSSGHLLRQRHGYGVPQEPGRYSIFHPQ